MSKPLQLTKILICGLVASTFLLANCQKAGGRSVKARMDSKAKTDSAVSLPPCSENVNKIIQERNLTIVEISKLFAESDIHELDAAQKTQLGKLGLDLKPKTEELINEIKLIKQGAGPALGCNQADPKQPTKKVSHLIEKITIDDLKINKRIAELAKGSAVKDEDKDKDKDKSVAADTTLAENLKFKIADDFAKSLLESNLNGKIYYSSGAIHEGEKAADELKDLIEKNKTSVCFLELVSGEQKSEDLIVIKLIGLKTSSDKKHVTAKIIFAGKEDNLSSLECHTPNVDTPKDELRKVFGELIKLDSAN